MRVSLEPGWLIVQCNEIGFTEANVKALCKIGASTKKSQEGYIGGHRYFHTTVPCIDYGLILLQERRVLVSCISCFYGMLKLNWLCFFRRIQSCLQNDGRGICPIS